MGIETALLIAGTVVSAGSAIQQGRQAKAVGEYQAAQAAADADAARGQSLVQAERIREAGKRQRSAAVAAQAASGVNIGEGTAELINTEITRDAEQDALTAIYSGRVRGQQLDAQGQAARISGDNAGAAGYLNAAGSALRAGANFDGWKTSQRTARRY